MLDQLIIPFKYFSLVQSLSCLISYLILLVEILCWSLMGVNPLTPRSNFNSPYCQPYISYNVSSENLVLDQLIIPKLIFFFILITYLVDIVLIL